MPKEPDRLKYAVSVSRVTRSFVAADGRSSYTAIKDVSLDIRDGEFVSIVGPTGCGKSTLLNAIAGLIAPSHGTIKIFEEQLTGLNRSAGYMFQAESLVPWLTALRNVSLGLEWRGTAGDEADATALSWLERVGLRNFADRYPHQLSGGMKKRVSLAQCLVLQPRLLLMDEPFSALDIQTRQMMENELLDIWAAEKMSVLFVTHDLEEAISLSDRVVVLSAGPGASIVSEFPIDIERPRDVMEIVQSPHYILAHKQIWDCLKTEVIKSYAQSRVR